MARRPKPFDHQRFPANGMEHLWSPAGATGGNRWQMGRDRKPLKQADPQPVATHGNRFAAHGKEGSTVRVRQRASRKASKWPFSLVQQHWIVAVRLIDLSPKPVPNIAAAVS